MFHPVHHAGGRRPDKRYSIELEWCGHDRPHYVARFCGEWIGSSRFRSSATMLAIGHNARRLGAPVFIEESAA